MSRLLNESKAGINANKKFENELKNSVENFEIIKNDLKKEETNLIAQKNILSKDEYQKKINQLRERTKEYRTNRKIKVDKLRNRKISISRNFYRSVNPIIADYAASKSISIVIQKKNIIIGKTELDITNQILKIINNKLKEIKLK